ncbi:MAG TPA: tetratricopeptide repeat protein [Dissulfurispiraceae bacterium]|nr:tetratricopeptide repeat protein [Dissulfurispiraceae bacterium]
MTKRLFYIVCCLAVLTAFTLNAASAASAEQTNGTKKTVKKTAKKPAKKGIKRPAKKISEGMQYKIAGDKLARQEDFSGAAKLYVKAMELEKGFKDAEVLDMARVMAWGGMLPESRRSLEELTGRNDANNKTKILLAEVYFWEGTFDRSRTIAEEVLRRDPGNREAVRIQADVLRVTGDPQGAIPLYEGLLNSAEDFDTRIGYAYALLALKGEGDARAAGELLKPQFAYQQREKEELFREIARVAQTPKALKGNVLVEPPAAPRQPDAGSEKKLLGDQFAAAQEHGKAADAYLEALSLKRDFTDEDRLSMATVLSWGGRLSESRQELETLLRTNPANNAARLQYARVLLWSGEYDACLAEIDKILAVAPNDRQALTVQASAYRLQHRYRLAIPLYQSLLASGDDFDIREGLTHAYVSSGLRLQANENFSMLYWVWPYQLKAYRELRDAKDLRFDSMLSPWVSYYHDSDHNNVSRIGMSGSTWLGNVKTMLDYQHVNATAPGLHATSEVFTLGGYARMPYYGGLGAGISWASPAGVFGWKVSSDLDVGRGKIAISAAREFMTDTAEVIEKRIRLYNFSVSGTQDLSDRFTVFGSIAYRDYSDDNSAYDLSAGISYRLMVNPWMRVGYRVRFMDFRRQSFGGYFDPDNFLSNQVFLAFAAESKPFYISLEPYVGHESFSRYGDHNSNFVIGGAGTLGYRAFGTFGLEIPFEAGNNAVGAGGGGSFHYYQVGIRAFWSF